LEKGKTNLKNSEEMRRKDIIGKKKKSVKDKLLVPWKKKLRPAGHGNPQAEDSTF